MARYYLTICDCPDDAGSQWPSATRVPIEAESDAEARAACVGIVDDAATALPEDDYAAGQPIYGFIWGEDGHYVGTVRYVLEAEDIA